MDKKAVEAVLQQCGLAEEYAKQEAVFLWTDIVGRLSAFAEAAFVRDGVLHVVACNSSVAQELNLLTSELLRQLNKRLHGGSLHGIHISTGDLPRQHRELSVPAQPASLSEEKDLFAGIEDPQLRSAFVSVYRRQRRREVTLEASGGRRCPRCGVTYVGRDPICPGCRYEAIEESSQAN